MLILTADRLVELVGELQREGGGRLVSAVQVMQRCAMHEIDCGPPVNKHIWASDLAEAADGHRLLKFRTSAERGGRVYLALRLETSRAIAEATTHPARAEARARGWVECVWLGRRWDWKNAQIPPA